MVDIDYFKKYNDHYGHLQGDRILVQVAQLLSMQQANLLVRFGGEEFILVTVGDEENSNWLNDLPSQFEQLKIPHVTSEIGYVTVSVGIATLNTNTHQDTTKKQLLSVADKCLYQAKTEGRNCICSQAL